MTQRRWWFMGGALALVAGLGLAVWWFRTAPGPKIARPEPRYEIPKTVSYSFTLKNTTGRLLENAQFWTYAPVKQTSTQRCCTRLEASQPYELDTDTWENQALHFRLAPLPPYASRIIRITAELRQAAEPNRLAPTAAESLLAAEPFVETDHPLIRAKAAELTGTDRLTTARRIYTWVAENVRDTGYVRQDHGALYALQQRQGDCTENMYLFMALARANGIAAQAVAGYVVAGNGVLRPQAYHNWAEFDADGVWRIADPQGRVFANRYAGFVAMRIGSAAPDERFKAQRFWYSGDGLMVTMN